MKISVKYKIFRTKTCQNTALSVFNRFGATKKHQNRIEWNRKCMKLRDHYNAPTELNLKTGLGFQFQQYIYY